MNILEGGITALKEGVTKVWGGGTTYSFMIILYTLYFILLLSLSEGHHPFPGIFMAIEL